jgi:RNA polymerase sigma-70 factor, ECF subfamily
MVVTEEAQPAVLPAREVPRETGTANLTPTARSAERLFVDYGPRVYRLARYLLGNDADAEDATQDTFVQVLRKLPTFRAEASLPTWLYRVAVNAALACRRRRAAHARHQASGDPATLAANSRHLAPGCGRRSDPAGRALDRERHRLIEEAIARLPEDYRDVYVLADVKELSCPEIAEVLGLSVAAVKCRLHRARQRMRRALAPYFEGAA